MNEEGVTAILGLVLLMQENQEVRVPAEVIARGLPSESGVQVWHDENADELVVRIASFAEMKADGTSD